MISDAYVIATCDECMDAEEEIQLTALAASGEYDMRYVPGALRRLKWEVDGDRTICPDCVEARKP